jgi:hypothetical protein
MLAELIAGAVNEGVAMVASVRRMWQNQYTHRWRYMALAVPAFLLLTSFLALDIYNIVQG